MQSLNTARVFFSLYITYTIESLSLFLYMLQRTALNTLPLAEANSLFRAWP